MAIDPVCQMEVEEESALRIEGEGQTYFFCSAGCLDRFLNERTCRQSATDYDLIIIGGGPAGLTAATFAATLRIKAFMISQDLGGQAVDSSRVENYMGFDFITGPELVDRFRHQLIQSHYIDHLVAGVERIEVVASGFQVFIDGGVPFHSRAVILATGMTRNKLNVPGEEKFQRRGIFYGQIPDFSFVEGEAVAVIGGGNSALQIVETLQPLARHVHLISWEKLTADPTVKDRILGKQNLSCHEFYETLGFDGEQSLSGVRIRCRNTGKKLSLPVKGAFISIGLRPNSALAAGLAGLNEKGEILAGPDGSTSCRGLFAAGDVTDVFAKRIIIATGDGAKAAIAARQYLLRLNRESRVPQT